MIYLEIRLPLKDFNLNVYTQNARTHWAVSYNRKKEIQEKIKIQVRKQRIEKIKSPCQLIAVWQAKQRNFDLDNMLLKTVLDQLQKMELLENDNVNHIFEITHRFEVNKVWQGLKLYLIERKN